MKEKRSIVVIWGGPGGYVAAIRAAQLGAEVTLVEKNKLGGTCLNVGCIPTKVLLHTTELFNILKKPQSLGLKVEGTEIDWDALMKRKERIVKRLVTGVKGLLQSNGVKVVQGKASFVNKNEISVLLENGEKSNIESDFFIIATGSVPFMPPIEGINLSGVINSTEALSLANVPKSMVIIGGGVIGVEFATIYASLGCKVTIIEMMLQILPNMDEELVEILKKNLVRKGIKVINNAKVTKISKDESSELKVNFIHDEEELELTAQNVLVSVGRKVYLDGLNLENLGINFSRSEIVVNRCMQTNVDNIYAIGDCTGKNMLAHVASTQGVVAAENIMGLDVTMDYKTVPSCIYTQPEMASVGFTEKGALEKGYEIKIGRFPLIANGKSLIMEEKEGIVKIIADEKYNEILGVHILGPRATDLIVEGALALRLEATLEEIITTIHAHPTVGEAMLEAALAAENIAIHIPNKSLVTSDQY